MLLTTVNFMKRKDICEYSKKFLGVPFRHQGRTEFGLDCAGLIVKIAKDCKLYEKELVDIKGYAKVPDGESLRNALLKGTAKEKAFSEIKEADIILMSFMREPQHLALYLGNGKIIHAYQGAGKVVIHDLDSKWSNRIVSVFQFFNVEEE